MTEPDTDASRTLRYFYPVRVDGGNFWGVQCPLCEKWYKTLLADAHQITKGCESCRGLVSNQVPVSPENHNASHLSILALNRSSD